MSTQHLPPVDVGQRYRVEEAAQYLRISRARLYKHLADGTIRGRKDGRRTLIPGSEIARLSEVQP